MHIPQYIIPQIRIFSPVKYFICIFLMYFNIRRHADLVPKIGVGPKVETYIIRLESDTFCIKGETGQQNGCYPGTY